MRFFVLIILLRSLCVHKYLCCRLINLHIHIHIRYSYIYIVLCISIDIPFVHLSNTAVWIYLTLYNSVFKWKYLENYEFSLSSLNLQSNSKYKTIFIFTIFLYVSVYSIFLWNFFQLKYLKLEDKAEGYSTVLENS